MKLFSLTDIETPLLKQRGLVGHTIAVGPVLLAPGASQDVTEEQIQHFRLGIQELITAGALALGTQPPASYALAKERSKPVKASVPEKAEKAEKAEKKKRED